MNVFQSWNMWAMPAPERVISRSYFERPVLSLASLDGLARLSRLQGVHGLYCVGSYALAGMPLLDNGVASGLRVAAALGGRLPWEAPVTAAAALEELRSPLRMPRVEAEARMRSAAWVVRGVAAGVVTAALAGVVLAALGLRIAVQKAVSAKIIPGIAWLRC